MNEFHQNDPKQGSVREDLGADRTQISGKVCEEHIRRTQIAEKMEKNVKISDAHDVTLTDERSGESSRSVGNAFPSQRHGTLSGGISMGPRSANGGGERDFHSA